MITSLCAYGANGAAVVVFLIGRAIRARRRYLRAEGSELLARWSAMEPAWQRWLSTVRPPAPR